MAPKRKKGTSAKSKDRSAPKKKVAKTPKRSPAKRGKLKASAEETLQMESEISPSDVSIEALPNEALEAIMSHLPLRDRKIARQVCKRWNSISYAPKLIQNDCIKIRNWSDLNRISPTSRYANVAVYVSHRRSYALSSFWKRQGSDIRSLLLHPINAMYPKLGEILSCCPNLESLVLCGNGEVILPKEVAISVSALDLSKLMNLALNRIDYVPQNGLDVLHAIFADLPKLQKLLVSSGVRDYDEEEEGEDLDIYAKLTLSIVRTAAATLKELDLDLPTSDEIFRQIIEIIGSQLTRLSTGDGLTNAKLNVISEKCDSLKQFSTGGNHVYSGLSNSAILRLLHRFEKSTHLSLAGIIIESVPLPPTFNRLDTLVAIDLSSTKITSDNLIAAFSAPHPNLSKLLLDDLSAIDGEVLNRICPNVPNLSYLSLNDCQIDNSVLGAICSHSKKLKYLDLNDAYVGYQTPIDVTLLNVLTGLHCLGLGGRRIQGLGSLTLPNLNICDIDDVNHYVTWTKEDIRCLIRNCPSLHDFGFYSMTIDDQGLDDILSARKRVLKTSGPQRDHTLLFLPPSDYDLMV